MANPPAVIEQYNHALAIGGILDRSNRRLIELTGRDRTRWLDSLITNALAPLAPGQAAYALALNVKGRVLFDLQVLVLPDRLWLDVDKRLAGAALSHLDHHLITEDVTLRELGNRQPRLTLLGPRAAEVFTRLGLTDVTALTPQHHRELELGGAPLLLHRRELAGLPAIDVYPATVSSDSTRAFDPIGAATAALGLVTVDQPALDALRIEAGESDVLDDFDEATTALDTGLHDRAISFSKGCYLGQEIVERMRSHGGPTRRPVGVAVEGNAPVPPGSLVRLDGREVGRTRTGCWSEALQTRLSLALLKIDASRPDTLLSICENGHEGGSTGVRPARVVDLPVRR